MTAERVTIADLLAQGDTCSVEQAAAVLKISRGSAYAAAREGSLGALHFGARWVVPTRRLAALVGVPAEECES